VFAATRCLLTIACLVALGAAPASATVPADLCTGNPCTVTGAKTIDAGSNLAFGAGTDLVFAASAVVTVGPGAGLRTADITARSITLQAGARILGGGDISMVMLTATGGDLLLQSAGSTRSRIDLSANQGGTLIMSASGNVEVNGLVTTAGSGTDSQGGDISIDAGGTVTVSQALTSGAAGAGSGGGETAIFATGSVVLNGSIDTSAADFGGGPVTLSSDTGDITTTQSIDVSGGGPDGSGGLVDVTAAGNVSIGGTVSGRAGSGIDFACGDGGELSVLAGGAVTLGASVDMTSGTQCFGGEIAISAGLDFTQLTGVTISSRGPGTFGGGGTVLIGARNVTLRGVDLSSPGSGGTLDAVATGMLEVLAKIDAQATSGEGAGGVINLQSCTITVGPSGFLDTRGAFAFPGTGINKLQAGGLITILGQSRAQTANQFEHRGLPPVITGTVAPAPAISVNPALPDCIELPQCGNDMVDGDEACDDGNNLSCDGCNADCTRVDAVCGDGTRECTEQCDDGNTDGGDGCDADCTLPASAGLLLPGVTLPTAGCLAEWKLAIEDGAINPNTLLPSNTQTCVDGDPRCDTDGARDGVCTFGAQMCLRVPDERLPDCDPAALSFVNIKQPQLPGGSNPLDQNNAQQLADGLVGLGVEVRSGNTILQSAPPFTGSNVCSATMSFKVAHAPAGLGKRAFNLTATDVDGLTMSSNLARLWCAPNTSECGNGVTEVAEQCDDGNAQSCDGCTATCRIEACGNGILECSEQCDDGPLNGQPGNRCSASCTELPPEVRIPGGGAKPTDCAFEWALELGQVTTDAKGLPKNLQSCTDNDPACDFDPTVGSCRFRVWGCAGGADSRLACSAAQVSRVDVRAPSAKAKRAEDIAARVALLDGLDSLSFPAGPGEACSEGFEVDVPAGNRRVTLRVQALLASGKKDIDPLALRCVP
jgi:cysteine-rich repeat protein